MPDPTPAARVVALYVYPVKSLGGVPADALEIDDFGPAGDRRWMLVDDDGEFMTQRTDARLALVRAEPRMGGAVRLHAPGRAPLDVDVPAADAPRRPVRIWRDALDAATSAPDVDAWLSDAIERPCHLVHMPCDVWRAVDPDWAGPGDRTSFTDGFPVSVLSRESVADLNARLAALGEAAVEERRFRPNVVVAGAGVPYAEDGWRDVRVGSAAFRIAKPLGRCVVTTIDPVSAAVSSRGEPLRTMASYRTRNGKVQFAQNALVRAPGVVRIGDAVLLGDGT